MNELKEVVSNLNFFKTMSNPQQTGEVLKTLSKYLKEDRLKESQIDADLAPIKTCNTCRHFIRQESYNQQWGMYQFMYFSCEKGNDCRNCKLNCKDYEQGKGMDIFLSKEEKDNIERMI